MLDDEKEGERERVREREVDRKTEEGREGEVECGGA